MSANFDAGPGRKTNINDQIYSGAVALRRAAIIYGRRYLQMSAIWGDTV